MEAQQASRTAAGAAIMRALHQRLPVSARILDDPVVERLVDPQSPAFKAREASLNALPHTVRARLTNFVMRSRFAEDRIAAAVQQGVRQYVILGAGLDTFSYRQPTWSRRLKIVEVDHPATQNLKKACLRDSGVIVPDNVTFASVDFETVSLTEGLLNAGVDVSNSIFFSMLGVSQYLSRDALRETLQFVRSMPASSEIVLSIVLPDHLLPADEACLAANTAARLAALGEPWLTRSSPEDMINMLLQLGFRRAAHLTPEEANKLYFTGRADGLSASLLEQMVHAVV